MSSWQFAVKSLLRDLRAGELSVLLMAIIIAVTAMTAVGFFTDRVGRAIKLQAGAVLAGDVVVRAPAPLQPSFIDAARALGIDTAESLSFLTMVLPADTGNEGNTLSQITAVSEGYPLRGEFLVARAMFGETESAVGIPAAGTGWAAPGLLGPGSNRCGGTDDYPGARISAEPDVRRYGGDGTGSAG